ncbi:TlpA disulfide reductase family protein [Aquisphaera insulae]|uniref:TlpA disulfide reductase family protein n=1 Tax=Aquisphaera insulae TaxID=2712864 RepID=UPI0013EBBD22|nr:TlpA disulfide reductase family protein [Aquisphaera insulae]
MRLTRILIAAVSMLCLSGIARSQDPAPPPTSVASILDRSDRTLVRDLGEYLRQNPKSEDRDQGYAALFNKAIEHDWFADTEDAAQRYVKNDPDGPVKALAQIVLTMARAGAGRYDEALTRYKELIGGLGKPDQEDFATSFTENFAGSAVTAGEFAVARQAYTLLQDRFPESTAIREKVGKELGRIGRVGKPLPEFEAIDLNGKPVKSGSLKGKYVLVDFWATWCAPCLTELPRLQDAYRKYHAEGLEILAVSLDETRTPVADFVTTRKIPWLQVHNGSAATDLVEAFGVGAIPASYLVDPEGNIIRLDLRGPALDAVLSKLVRKESR